MALRAAPEQVWGAANRPEELCCAKQGAPFARLLEGQQLSSCPGQLGAEGRSFSATETMGRSRRERSREGLQFGPTITRPLQNSRMGGLGGKSLITGSDNRPRAGGQEGLGSCQRGPPRQMAQGPPPWAWGVGDGSPSAPEGPG